MKHWLGGIVLCGLLSQSPAWAAVVNFTPRAQADLKSGRYPWLKQVEPILQQVSRLRGLPIKKSVLVETLNRQQLQQELNKHMKADMPPERLEGEQALYTLWGMLPPHYALEKTIIELYSSQIGGFYDPATQVMYLIKDIPLGRLDMDMLLAHELTHALQDQAYQLKPFLESQHANDDALLARQALVEGDATYISTEYMTAYLAKKPDVIGLLDSIGTIFRLQEPLRKLQQVPGFLKNTLMFPYTHGTEFVQHSLNNGLSWSDLYRKPPSSTTHIMHPQRYSEGYQITTVKLETAKLMPFKRLSDNVCGEKSLYELFYHHGDRRWAEKTVSGWQGDRYAVYRTPNGHALSMVTTWSNQAEAQEFYQGYAHMTELRYPQWKKYKIPGKAQIHGQLEGYDLVAAALDQETIWQSATQNKVWLGQQGNKVAILETPSIDPVIGDKAMHSLKTWLR